MQLSNGETAFRSPKGGDIITLVKVRGTKYEDPHLMCEYEYIELLIKDFGFDRSEAVLAAQALPLLPDDVLPKPPRR